MWQDWVLMLGGFGFFIALLPTIFGESKPATVSSLVTFILLAMFAWVYASLGLWKAVGSNGLTALAWGILFIQKLKVGGKNG